MTQLKTDPITEGDITDFLADNDDFAFEMKVFQETQIGGIECYHGWTYTDPTTTFTRQFDIRAKIRKPTGGVDPDLEIVNLAVECKNLHSYHPLVISCTPRGEMECFVEVVRSHSVSSMGHRSLSVSRKKKHLLYPEGSFVGKSTAQLGRKRHDGSFVDNDSSIFEKWAQAIASSHEMTQSLSDASVYPVQIAVINSATIPVVVVPDKALWIVNYDETGQRIGDPHSADECKFYVGQKFNFSHGSQRHKTVSHTMSHLHFLTVTGYQKFSSQLQMNDHFWADLFGRKTEN